VKKRIEGRKALAARLEGQRDQLLDTLRKDHGLDSLLAAQAEIDKLDGELAAMERELVEGVAELERMLADD